MFCSSKDLGGKYSLYLLDSDVARKICQYHLLNELAMALGCGLEGFTVLPQLRFQLKLANPASALSRLGSVEAFELANQLIAAASEVIVVADTANPILGLNRPDLDSGEAALFAALHEAEEDSVISGDKRAFVALAQVDGEPLIDALWARMICLEEAMFLILECVGLAVVSEKIRARPEVDTALSIIFGRAAPNDYACVRTGLESYMENLRSSTGGKYISTI